MTDRSAPPERPDADRPAPDRPAPDRDDTPAAGQRAGRDDTPHRAAARMKFGRWPGVVWAVPVAALLIVGYLGLRAYAHRGVDVTVTFPTSGGAMVGDTKVIYRGVESGRVTRIRISKDAKHVDMTLRLDPRAKPTLRKNTVFWMVGANVSLTDISSLKAALAGVSIGVAPGDGPPARHFVGLDREPPVLPNAPGRYFRLSTEQVGSMRAGADVFYHGLNVGKVADIELSGPQVFQVRIFVKAPYDRLVREDSLFWLVSPVQISLTGEGLSTQFAPANAAIAGGVEFNTPPSAANEPESPNDFHYELYQDRGRAIAGGRGPQVLYDLAFKGGVGDLDEGAPVKLGGRQIGAVQSVGFSIDAQTGVISQPITISLRPLRLNLTGAGVPGVNGDWRPATDRVIAHMLARGYRIKLAQSPPLIGPRTVTLEKTANAGPGAIAYGGTNPRLPTVEGADADALADKASAILDKVNAVPIAQIGENVRRLTAHLDALTGSPKVKDSLDHLDSTLNQVDAMVRQVKPQVGPLVAKLNTAADQLNQTAAAANGVLSGDGAAQGASLPGAIRELTDAARSIRSLTDYLGRHPEAVLKGKVKER